MFSKKMKQVNKAHVITSSSGVIQVIEVRDAPPFSSSNLTPEFGYCPDTGILLLSLQLLLLLLLKMCMVT